MRTLGALLLVLVLGGLVAWSLGWIAPARGAPEVPGNEPTESLATAGRGRAGAPGEASRAVVPTGPAEAVEDPAAPRDPTRGAPAAVSGADPGAAILELEVVDSATGRPLPGFRYVLAREGQPPRDLTVEGAVLELPIPRATTVTLAIEAVGYVPAPPQDIELAPSEDRRRLRVALEPAQRATGVVLHVRDASTSQPVERLRVRTWRRDVAAAEDTPFVRLWERTAANADGEYRLPDLAPGQYRFRLQAVDEASEPLALCPVEHRLTFWGAQHIPAQVDLQPGVLVSLAVVDASGTVLGTEVVVRVEDARGDAIETRWRHRAGDQVQEAIDMLPFAARCLLADPLPPGAYTLKVRRGDGPIESRRLDLVLGGRQDLTISL